MLRRLATITVLAVAASAWSAQSTADYYKSVRGQIGTDLRAVLHTIIRGHTVLPYSSSSRTDTADALSVLDEDPANTNNVFLIYAQRTQAKNTFGATTGWNREHLWCDSYGLDDTPPSYTDLHNLRAEDANVNSARGNKFYDARDSTATGYKNPAHTEAPLCTTDSDSWEPPDRVKGDIARALFYMAVRYTGDVTNEPALRLTDRTELITSTNTCMGRLTTLLLWSAADPPDSAEQLRNDLVYSLFQTNRNPFVDLPALVNHAFAPALRITPQPAGVRLSWSTDYQGWLVEAAVSPSGPWNSITGTGVVPSLNPVAVNGQWQLDMPGKTGAWFFRLRPRS